MISLFIFCVLSCSSVGTKSKSISREKSIVDRIRTATLKMHVESTPAGAYVIFQFPDWIERSSKDTVYHTPCDREIGYTEEIFYSDGSKERRGVLGGNFAFYHGGMRASKVELYTYWDKTPTHQDLEIKPFCVPLHFELQGYSALDTTVCFNKFADEVKVVNVILEKRIEK